MNDNQPERPENFERAEGLEPQAPAFEKPNPQAQAPFDLMPLLRTLSWMTILPGILGVIALILIVLSFGSFGLLLGTIGATFGIAAWLIGQVWMLSCLALLALSIYALVKDYEPRLTIFRYILQSVLFLAIGSGFVGAITQS